MGPIRRDHRLQSAPEAPADVAHFRRLLRRAGLRQSRDVLEYCWPQLWRQFAPHESEVGCAKPAQFWPPCCWLDRPPYRMPDHERTTAHQWPGRRGRGALILTLFVDPTTFTIKTTWKEKDLFTKSLFTISLLTKETDWRNILAPIKQPNHRLGCQSRW